MLHKPVKHVLYIKLRVDGKDFLKLPYKHESDNKVETEPFRWSLNPFL